MKHGTLNSIFSSEVQKWTKSKFAKAQDSANEIYNKYKQSIQSGAVPGVIMRLADEYELPYSLTAKIILTKHVVEGQGDANNDNHTMQLVKKQLRNTTLINDKQLAYEVFLVSVYIELFV